MHLLDHHAATAAALLAIVLMEDNMDHPLTLLHGILEVLVSFSLL